MQSSQVRDLVKRFGQMREMMAALGGSGMFGKLPGMGRLAGAGAPGFDPQALMQGASRGGGSRAQAARARDRSKKKRKQARKDRKKGRRK
jgi:hypothetical protein